MCPWLQSGWLAPWTLSAPSPPGQSLILLRPNLRASTCILNGWTDGGWREEGRLVITMGPTVSLYYREEPDQVPPACIVLLLSTPPANAAPPCTQPLTPGVSNRDSRSLSPAAHWPLTGRSPSLARDTRRSYVWLKQEGILQVTRSPGVGRQAGFTMQGLGFQGHRQDQGTSSGDCSRELFSNTPSLGLRETAAVPAHSRPAGENNYFGLEVQCHFTALDWLTSHDGPGEWDAGTG